MYITLNEADRFAFFLLWDELRHRQSSRFRFGESKLLGLSCFARSFLDLTPMRYCDSKLVQENSDIRAPPKGQMDICFYF